MIRVLTNRVTTKINVFILSALLIAFTAALPGTAMGQSAINIDFEAGAPGDATFVSDDAQYGILSTPGPAVWNSVDPNQDKNNLLDETGAPTGVDIKFGAGPSSGVTFTPPLGAITNDMQYSGIQGGSFRIDGLRPDGEYTLAIYGESYSQVTITDVSGVPYLVDCIRTMNSYSGLPGYRYSDYCLLEGIEPYLSGAEPFIEIQPSAGPFGEGVIMGTQIRGDLTPTECIVNADCDDGVDCTVDECDDSYVCRHNENDYPLRQWPLVRRNRGV